MAKLADFGDDFAKLADFMSAGHTALSDVLAAFEQAPAGQVEAALPELRKRAQRSRHTLETLQADFAKLVAEMRSRSASPGNGQGQEVHVHVHLHVNTDNGTVTRTDR